MESFAAGVTLLLLFGLLSGGGVVAASDCESTTFPVRGAANQLAAAAACTTHSAHLSTGGATAVSGPTCDAPLMASQLTKLCNVEMDAPGALCCAAVLMTVEQDTDCLCRVAEAAEFDLSDLSVAQVWEWYKSCGGRRRSVPQDEKSCEPSSAPPPPPPAKPEAPSAWPLRLRLWLAVGLLCAAAVATAIFGALKLCLPRTVQAPRMQGQVQWGKLNLGQDQDVKDAAITGVPQVTSGPGDVRPRADEDAANAIATGQKTSGSGEEEASPPVSPLRVEGRSQVARARLPPPPPFEPPPPPVVPPETVMPGAPPVIMAF